MPKVSILTTVYNEEKYIRESIESALRQSFSDFEFVIVEDGSTDGTLSIIKNYAASDDRIKIIENKKNLGRQKSLNIGLKESKGTYIACLDGDDIWSDAKKIEKQISFLDKNPKYGIVGTSMIRIAEHGEQLDHVRFCETDKEIREHILFSFPFAHPSVMIRKKAAEEAGFYDESEKFKHIEDYEFVLRIGTKFKLANLPDYCLKYRLNPKGVSMKNQFRQKIAGIRLSSKYRRNYPHASKAIIVKLLTLPLPRKTLDYLISKSNLAKNIYAKLSGARKNSD